MWLQPAKKPLQLVWIVAKKQLKQSVNMKKGTKIEIIGVSRGQQYDVFRPVNIGDKGDFVKKSGNVCYVILNDPKDGRPCYMWFHECDFKMI